MNQTELAWAAGLFEGEGSVGVYGYTRCPRMQLGMVDRDVVEHFARVVGVGRVRIEQGTNKPLWRWELTRADDVFDVMQRLIPFLGERRRAQWNEAVADYHEHRRKLQQPRTCLRCKAEFVPKQASTRQKYCTKTCSDAVSLRRRLADPDYRAAYNKRKIAEQVRRKSLASGR